MNCFVLKNDEFHLLVDPDLGGSVRSLTWYGKEIFYPGTSTTVLDGGMFTLVPFSNRISGSSFDFEGRKVRLSANHPSNSAEPVIHGYGWILPWHVISSSACAIEMRLEPFRCEWPWKFRANLRIELRRGSAIFELTVTNFDQKRMPVGLGFHPYFPRNKLTRYCGLHQGEWQVSQDRLPTSLTLRSQAIDWWDGEPVWTREVDTVYTNRQGELRIDWPDRGFGVAVQPSADLPFTTVYTPKDQDFFCVEPVSHPTDAVNRDEGKYLQVLEPGQNWSCWMQITPSLL